MTSKEKQESVLQDDGRASLEGGRGNNGNFKRVKGKAIVRIRAEPDQVGEDVLLRCMGFVDWAGEVWDFSAYGECSYGTVHIKLRSGYFQSVGQSIVIGDSRGEVGLNVAMPGFSIGQIYPEGLLTVRMLEDDFIGLDFNAKFYGGAEPGVSRLVEMDCSQWEIRGPFLVEEPG